MGRLPARLKLFGDFQAWSGDNQPVELKLKRARLLLAYLALASSGRASRVELMTLLWSERDDAQARQSLRQTIAVVRRAFPANILRSDQETVSIDLNAVESDAVAFKRLASESSEQDLEQAATLYTGDFLAGLFVRDPLAEDWISERRAELQSSLLRCLGLLLVAYARLERHDAVEQVASRILELDPLDEEAHRALMTVYLARGQRSLAFRQLQRCRKSLLRDLSVAPAPETEALIGFPVASQTARADATQRCVAAPIDRRLKSSDRAGDILLPARNESERARARAPSRVVAPFDVLGDGRRADLLACGPVDDVIVGPSRFSSLFVVPDRPYVAVLPFQNLSVDPEQEYVADGIVEEITTALSRFPSLFVIARDSSFTGKGGVVDIRLVGRELGVRYVLQGSVRKAGNRVRITGQLVQTETGIHLWADCYERDLGDIFALQDEMATSIVGALVPSVERAEMQRACRKPPNSLDSYGLYLRAMAALNPWTKEGTDEALELLEQALALDPNCVAAILLAENCWSRRNIQGWSPPAEALRESARLARLAVQMDPENAEAIAVLAHRTPAINHGYEEAISLAAQAVAMNPSSAFAWGQSGWGLVYAGCPEQALLHFQRTLRLNPRDPRARNYLSGMVLALIQLERDTEAVAMARKAVQHCPSGAGPWCVLTGSLALTGQLDEARVALGSLLELDPNCSLNSCLRFGFSERARGRYFEGLRRAGMPK